MGAESGQAPSTELSTFSWASSDHGNFWSEMHEVDWQTRGLCLYTSKAPREAGSFLAPLVSQ